MLKELQAQTYINLKRLDLVKWEDGSKRPLKLTWALRDGYPRITIYLNTEKKGIENMIIAPFLPPEAATFIELLKRLPNAENNTEYKVELYNIKWENGEKTKERYLQAIVTVGKNENGICYIKVESGDKTKSAQFELLPNSRWFKFFKNGEEITSKTVMSKLFTAAYADQINHIFNTLNTYFSIINFAEPTKVKDDVKDEITEEDIEDII